MRALPQALLAAILTASLVTARDPATELRVARLVATGKLWATIKYFHPALGESNPAEWDGALLDSIPKVKVAEGREAYADALRQMLARLQDSVTRIEEEGPEISGSQLGFASVELQKDVLLVRSGALLGDPLDSAEKVTKQLPAANAVIFDLREGPVHPWLWDSRTVGSDEPVPFPAHRFRLHVGSVPPRGAEGAPFFSGTVTRAAPLTGTPTGGSKKRVVFLVSRSEQIPSLAAALQAIGVAYIVAEQRIDDRAMARHGFARHYRMPVGEGLVAFVRTSEMLHADGTVGLIADRVAAGDGMAAALQAAAGGIPHARRPAARAAYQVKAAEQPYAETSFPDEPLRVLGAFRIWAAFEWLYPYRELMDRDWEQVLRETLPKLMAARDAREYHLTVAEMVASVGDSHAVTHSSVMTEFWGDATPPLALRPVEGRPVVVAITDPSAHSSGVSVGDVVTAVDGQPTDMRLANLAHYISASTPQALRRDAVNRLLRGPEGSPVQIRLLKADGTETNISLERKRQFLPLSWEPATGGVSRTLQGNIGYVDLRVLRPHQVVKVFGELKDTNAIIFDMRGYPNDTRFTIASQLADRTHTPETRISVPIALEPGTATIQTLRISRELQPTASPYRGKTVMLIDDRAQSQAEATAQVLRAVHGTVFVGSPTTGANGEGSNITVPGGIGVGMTATGVRNLDGTQLQRVGIKPDIEVHPTIAGIRAGRDEVLERAVDHVLNELK